MKQSQFLMQQKELLQRLIEVLNKDFSYVSILGVDTKGTSYAVKRTGCEINDSMWSERGFVARVYNGINYSEYSFNEISDETFENIYQEIKRTAIIDIEALASQNLILNEYPLIEEEILTRTHIEEVEKDPFEVGPKEKISLLTELMEKGLAVDELLIDFRVKYEEVKISKVFLSTKRNLEQVIIYTTAALIPIAKRDAVMKYSFKNFSGLKGLEILDELSSEIEPVVKEVIELLDAEKIVPGMYDVICDPDVSGLIAHEAFGHGVEMDMFVKGRAKGMEYIGKEVASDSVVMHDGATSTREVGTYLFDDEGVLGTDTVIIKDKILQKGISDLLSSMKLGTTPTGNGRRESYQRKAYARMTNTFFAPGKDKLEDMIASIENGYLLEGYYSGMEDPKNWGIQCLLAKGKEIKNGKLTGKIVSPVMMTGYVPDLLKSITMVSDELVLSGSGVCGKGHKEWVKTSTGGSFIKARGRLG